MTKKQKRMLRRILIGAAAFVAVMVTTAMNSVPEKYSLIINILLYLIPYLMTGGDVLIRAGKNILRGQVFDENFLMSIATIGAFAIGEYKEAVAVMLFYQVGELFQSYAVHRSRRCIADLMDIRPDYANIELDGVLQQVDPESIKIGQTIVVKPGERIPLDGIVLSGNSMLDTSALTGESLPREVGINDAVISGCINKSGLLSIEVTKEFGQSTVSKILELVENASNKKAKTENFITRFAKYYTPVVVIAATLLAVLPPLLLQQPFGEWVSRALIFLVISCPCALVISVPLSFFGGIGGASKSGILVKGSNYLEALSTVDTVVFDKTGTLTKGCFKVTEVYPKSIKKEELLEVTALAESFSNHPIAVSIKQAVTRKLDETRVKAAKEIAGHGVCTLVDGAVIYAGNDKLMKEQKIEYQPVDSVGTVVYVARAQQFLGAIVISDEIKEDALKAIETLKLAGIKKTVMLTGDSDAIGLKVANELKLDEVYTGLLPQDKVSKVEELLANQAQNKRLAFVGDGINDAPVLSRADIGIAMGALGSDAAIEAADVVLMEDQLSKIATAVAISRKTIRIVKQNIIFALGVKAIVLLMGAFGFATMWDAVFADVGVSVLAILNATRALKGNRDNILKNQVRSLN